MSTILDALRKVEEENRTRSADARARLLSFPARPDMRFSRRRTLWLVGAGLVFAGFAAGAGVMLLGPRSQISEDEQIARPTQTGSDPSTDKGSQPPVQPARATGEKPAVSLSAATEIASAPQTVIPPQSASALPQKPSAPRAPLGMAPASAASANPSPASPEAAPLTPEQFLAGDDTPPQELEQVFTGKGAQLEEHSRAVLASQMQALRKAAGSTRAAARTHPRGQGGAAPRRATPASEPQPEPQGRTASAEPPAPGIATRSTAPAVSAPEPSPPPPNSSLSFLQWSPEPEKRLAFIKLDGGPLTLAHEGDTVGGFTVVEIRRDEVELRSQGHHFTLQAQE